MAIPASGSCVEEMDRLICKLAGAGPVGIELKATLKRRKLLILRNSKRAKTAKTLNRGTCGVHGKDRLFGIPAQTNTQRGPPIRNPNSAQRSKTNPNYL
jgi:hypothetical protein